MFIDTLFNPGAQHMEAEKQAKKFGKIQNNQEGGGKPNQKGILMGPIDFENNNIQVMVFS